MTLQLAAIDSYLVKSLGELPLTCRLIERFVCSEGRFIMQQQLPQMVHVRVMHCDAGWQLQLNENQILISPQDVVVSEPCRVTV